MPHPTRAQVLEGELSRLYKDLGTTPLCESGGDYSHEVQGTQLELPRGPNTRARRRAIQFADRPRYNRWVGVQSFMAGNLSSRDQCQGLCLTHHLCRHMCLTQSWMLKAHIACNAARIVTLHGL